jgi:UDP-3-O-[3-hydroxymyristoyl] N-acetylglucosamine deacetylase/3-hydroxyacyl-[acyl-carrier-protein] dehydratase
MAKQFAKLMTMVPAAIVPKGGAVLDANDLMRILPHRYPFLMVDRVVAFEGDTKCTGVKSVTINEPFFQGHFPGHPVMPGVLQLEAMAQVASILLLRTSGSAGQIGYFMSADEVKFRKPVVPGDTLFIHVEMLKSRGRIAKAAGRCMVNDEVVSEANMMFGVVET